MISISLWVLADYPGSLYRHSFMHLQTFPFKHRRKKEEKNHNDLFTHFREKKSKEKIKIRSIL